MASRHIRTSSITSHHTRTASTSSEILITETVSSLQRCVFGNIFRSQRQLMRYGIITVLFVFVVYMLGPFSGSGRRVVSDPKPKASASLRSMEEESNSNSEYRATYFEEMGKRFADREWKEKSDSFHSSNHLDPEVKDDPQGSRLDNVQTELITIAEKVREAARVLSACKEIPGLSVVMVKGDQAIQVPVGMADVRAGRPVTMETRFLLGSISKTFLGQLLAVLITEPGRNLTWDTRVSDILGPDFSLATEELTREVTLADLLSHRSGLSSGNLAVRATYPQGWSRAHLIRNLQHLPPSAPFRKSFLYSNMGGTLAAYVAEILGGAPWEKLIVNKLLAPLDMLDSLPITSVEELEGDNFSRLYVPVEGQVMLADTQIFNLGPMAPVGLLSTTARDVSKWLNFNLRQGKLRDGRELIRPDVWLSMWSKQAELSPHFLKGADKSSANWPVKDFSEGYGLCWFRNRYRDLSNLWHGGALYSHHTLAWHFPERQVALYAVINGHSGNSQPLSVVESLMYHTADLLLGHQPWVDKNSLCAFPGLFSFQGSNRTQKNSSENQGEQQPRDVAHRDRDQPSLLAENSDRNRILGSSRVLFAAEKNVREVEGIWESTRQENGNNRDSPLLIHLENFARGMKPNLRVFNQNFGVFSLDGGDTVKQYGNSAARFGSSAASTLHPWDLYYGLYYNPLFGNFSVFYYPQSSSTLGCQISILNGELRYRSGHQFGLVYTRSHRFLSKPSRTGPAKESLTVTFVEGQGQVWAGQITAVDVSSEWEMEVAVRFVKVR